MFFAKKLHLLIFLFYITQKNFISLLRCIRRWPSNLVKIDALGLNWEQATLKNNKLNIIVSAHPISTDHTANVVHIIVSFAERISNSNANEQRASLEVIDVRARMRVISGYAMAICSEWNNRGPSAQPWATPRSANIESTIDSSTLKLLTLGQLLDWGGSSFWSLLQPHKQQCIHSTCRRKGQFVK